MQPQGQQKVKKDHVLFVKGKHGEFIPLEVTNLTPNQMMAAGKAYMPVGVYKGGEAFVDLDLMVNQPLVQAEGLHILGILDGREEGYDLRTVTVPLGTLAGVAVSGQLTVPAGELWLVDMIALTTPADNGGRTNINLRCSVWQDRGASPSALGQLWDVNGFAAAGGNTWYAEFHPGAPFIDPANKNVPLRLPGGTILTVIATNTIAAALGAMNSTLQVYGYRGKPLVV